MRGLIVVLTDGGVNQFYEDIEASYVSGFLNKNDIKCIYIQEDYSDFDILQYINEEIDFIIFALNHYNRLRVYEEAGRLKSEFQDIIVIAGGTEINIDGKGSLIDCQYIDYAVKGDGEITTYDLIRSLELPKELFGVPGILYRNGENIVENMDRPLVKDLSSLAWPDRTWLMEKGIKIAYVTTSRGCAGRCSFCSIPKKWNTYRSRAISDVLDELVYLHNEAGIGFINFTDASFEDPDYSCSRMNQLLDGILGLNFKLSFSVDFRAEFIRKCDEELLSKLIRAGLSRVVVGIEAANDMDIVLYNKRATLKDNYGISRLFINSGIPFYPGFINFNPYSTLKTLKENLDYIKEFRLPLLFFTKLTAFRGSKIYDKMKEDKLLTNRSGSYNFQNRDVEELYRYIKGVLRNLQNNGNKIIDEIDTGLERSEVFAYILKRKVLESCKSDIEEILSLFNKSYAQIKEELTEACIKWYKSLILAAEEKEYEKFNLITENLSIEVKLVEIEKSIQKNFMRLIKDITRFGIMLNL